ncbi:MAG: transglutaminaseTgpA domain-containing protein [Actinomycetota bacterium]
MSGKTVDYLRRLNAPREIEDSRPLRLAVWAAVVISVIALAPQGVSSQALVLSSVALITLGSFLSWRRRYRSNLAVKVVIMVLTVAALASFLRQVSMQPFDPRTPLAELFVWVQVLHSFDLPRGKDLLLSLVSSLILLALAGSFSLSASFGLIVLLWLAAAIPALYFLQLSRLRDLSAESERSTLPGASARYVVVMLVALVVVVSLSGLAVGAFMPRVSTNYLRSLPYSIRRALFSSEGYSFSNPGYPDLPSRPPDSALEMNPEAYFGFGTFLDLRTRGTMVDMPVMKVRSTEPAYWGGMSFQEYNGYAWVNPEEEPDVLRTSNQPFAIGYGPDQPHASRRTIVQTYYLEAEQPNVIFAAWRPEVLYYPSDFIFQGASGLKSPFILDDGLVYSVISREIVSGDIPTTVSLEAKGDLLRPFLDLPQVPDRVRALAGEITPSGAGPYARALAIEDFLKDAYEYSLDVPPLLEGADAVDYFLFEEQRGYCEHFASAYAVLCRLNGVPARVVTGYATGERNPFTGLYEVSLDDAHAWVEIYIEGIGWLTREPTPGFALPEAGEGMGALWIFRDFLSWMGRTFSALLPGSLRSALKAGLTAIVSSAASLVGGIIYSVREAPWLLTLLALVLLVLPLALLARRLGRHAKAPPHAQDGPLLAMRDFLAALASLGFERGRSQTAGEFIAGLRAAVPGLDLSGELLLFEQARYGRQKLPEDDVRRLEQGLSAALEQVRLQLKPRSTRRGRGGWQGRP